MLTKLDHQDPLPDHADPRPQAPAPQTILSDYLTREQLAAELGIAVHTLDNWRRERRAPAETKIGRQPMFRREVVRKWLLGLEVGGPRK